MEQKYTWHYWELAFRSWGSVHFYVLSQVHSEPPARERDTRVRPAYSEPQLRYDDPEQQDDYGPRSRYDDEDFRNGNKPAGFKEDTLERQRPSYKPSGNIVK